MKRFTIAAFKEMYPNDDACLDKIFKLRYTNLVCPKCENDQPFNKVKNRRSYQCPCCGFQVYPTKDTIFEKTTTPLTYWFFAIFLHSTSKNGVAALELKRQLEICYTTALRMSHQIKKLMANKSSELLTGLVELDEVFLGSRLANKHKKVRAELLKTNKGYYHKTPVFGMLQRGGNIITQIITEPRGDVLKPIIREKVSKDAIIITDGFGGYKDLHLEFKQHEILNHEKDEFARGQFHTNSLEGFWSQLKRVIRGTHIHVSKKYLQLYVDEVSFKYVNRDNPTTMFDTILGQVVNY